MKVKRAQDRSYGLTPEARALIRTRREEMGLSQKALAALVGLQQSSIHNIESGQSDRPTKEPKRLNAIAAALSIPLSKLRSGTQPDDFLTSRAQQSFDNPMVTAGTYVAELPVYYGQRNEETGEMIVSLEVVEHVARPMALATVKDAFGIRVPPGSQMEPAYEAGDVIFIHPYLPAVANRDVLLRPSGTDLRALIRRLVSETATEWRVTQFNPLKTYVLKKSDWPRVARIFGKYNQI